MLQQLLQQYFGYSTFRPGQQEVITKLVEGEDVIALLPTGTGKSLCYQLTGRVKDAPVLIISPLLSLMQDQVNQMKKIGFKRVIALNSFLSHQQFSQALTNLSAYDYIFTSPEMLQNHTVSSQLKALPLGLIVIDEAHCISEWGHDFRPDYLRLQAWLNYQQRPPIVALTATATPAVVADIKRVLQIEDAYTYLATIDRPEIRLQRLWFTTAEEKVNWIEDYVSTTVGPGIIYTSSRKRAEQLAMQLRKWHIAVSAYHGGVSNEDRQLIQEQFLADKLEWIVATSAFGMGVHKTTIRHIIHETMSPTLSSYMQEIGRAARDGQDALATVLCTASDFESLQFITDTLPKPHVIQQYYAGKTQPLTELEERLLAYWHSKYSCDQAIAYSESLRQTKAKALTATKRYMETSSCLRTVLTEYFDQTATKVIDCCTICGLDETKYRQLRTVVHLPTQITPWTLRLQQLLLK